MTKRTIDQYVESVRDINWDKLLSKPVEIEYTDRGAQVTVLGYVVGDKTKKVFLYREIYNCFVALKDMGFIDRILTEKQKVPKKKISRVTILNEDKNYRIDPNFKVNSLKQKESTIKVYNLLKGMIESAEQGIPREYITDERVILNLKNEANFPHGFPEEYEFCWSSLKGSILGGSLYTKEDREEMLISAKAKFSSFPDPAK